MDSDDFVPFTSKKDSTLNDSSGNISSSSSFSLPALITDVRAPWMQFSQSDFESDSSSSSLVRLHNEILTFCEYVAPTKAEMAGREQVVNEIVQITKEIWPEAYVKIFGSQMTKILTPSSDLDIAILNVPESKGGVNDLLYILERAIRQKDIVTYVEVLSNAKVPIVKFDHRRTGISVDICVNNDSGLHTGKLIKEFVRTYPPLRPLTLVLKMFLMREKIMKYRKLDHSWNLGVLLLEFFTLYGNTFNFVHTGISISKGGYYFQKLERTGWFNPQRPLTLALENPADPEIDIGKNSFMLVKIRRAFEHAQQVLTCALMDNRVESYLSFLIRPDDFILTGRPGPGLVTSGVSQISDSSDDGDNDDDDDDDIDSDDDNRIDDNNNEGNYKKKNKMKNKNKKIKKDNEKVKNKITEKEIINLESDDDIVEINPKNVKKNKNSKKTVEQVLYDENKSEKWDDEEVTIFLDNKSESENDNDDKITRHSKKNKSKKRSGEIIFEEKKDEKITKKSKK